MSATDRELLELAAKAAKHYGLDIEFDTESGKAFDNLSNAWDPRVHDGEALRLAAAMRLDILHDDRSVTVKKFDHFNQRVLAKATVQCPNHSSEYTRMAIFFVAFEIGRKLP